MNNTVDTQALPADAVDALPPHPKKLEREANRIVLAYYFRDKNGNKIAVSCPKRLLRQIQALGVEKYGEGCELSKLNIQESLNG